MGRGIDAARKPRGDDDTGSTEAVIGNPSSTPETRMYIHPRFSQLAALRLRGLRGCSITIDIPGSLDLKTEYV